MKVGGKYANLQCCWMVLKIHIFVFFFIISVVAVKYAIRLFLKRDRRLLEFCLTGWSIRVFPRYQMDVFKNLDIFPVRIQRERKKCLMSKIEEAIIWRIFLIESLLLCIEFHQHFTCSFFLYESFARSFFCTYILGLTFFVTRILAQMRSWNVGEIN